MDNVFTEYATAQSPQQWLQELDYQDDFADTASVERSAVGT